MSQVVCEFEFEIGDMVYFKDAAHDLTHVPNRFLILERWMQECHGGVQTAYKLNNITHPVPSIALTKEMPGMDPNAPDETARKYFNAARMFKQAKEVEESDAGTS